MPLTGGWVPQSFADYPFTTWSVQVDGTWYLGARARTNNGFSARDIPEVVEVNPDGSFTAYPQSLTLSEFAWKGAIAYGTTIYIPMFTRTNNRLHMLKFDTVTKAYTLLQLVTTTSFPGNGKGALGPDGMLYFPPFGKIGNAGGVLQVNPATDAMSILTFGGAWPADEYTGQMVTGGDGNIYFFPGSVTGAGGGFQSGTRMGYLSFPGPTLNLFPLPLPPNFADSGEASTWIACAPAPDGAYGITMGGNFYKVTTAGPVFLQGPTPWASPPWYVDNGELTDQVDLDSNLIEGPDGLFYTVGSHYNGSSNYSPVVCWIDPSNDEVHFQEFLDLTGKPFVGTAGFIHDGKLRTVSLRVGTFTFPDMFENSLVGDSAGTVWSFAVGSIPVSLALGAFPVAGSVG